MIPWKNCLDIGRSQQISVEFENASRRIEESACACACDNRRKEDVLMNEFRFERLLLFPWAFHGGFRAVKC